MDKKEEEEKFAKGHHLFHKREELVWSLNVQGYNNSQISWLFGLSKPGVAKIIDRRPKDYKSPWSKIYN